MGKKIKGRHVLVAGAGPSLKKYWDNIKLFIEKNNAITIGGNNINGVFDPDYHFWGCDRRWIKYGNLVSDKSVLIFPGSEREKVIRKHWQGPYVKYKTNKRPSNNHANYSNIYECFKNIVMVAAFWAYNQKASKISIVGMDGYTLYSNSILKDKTGSQHCYGEGFTDGFSYKFGRIKDIKYYERLKILDKYGRKNFGFGIEIITPTLYKKFYNSTILEIKDNYDFVEPSIKEKKSLGSWRKNKNLKKNIY